MEEKSFNEEWENLVRQLEAQFGEGLDLQGIIFLIGIQELGKGKLRLKKDEKLEVMHIAICRLLEPYGFYEYEGRDAEGWPHYKRTGKLPFLDDRQQQQLMKEAVLDYFRGS